MVLFSQNEVTPKLQVGLNILPSIGSLHFNNRVSLITSIPLKLNISSFYYSVSLQLKELLQPNVLKYFQSQEHQVYAISSNPNHEIVICKSVLRMRVSKDTYAFLGLQGVKSRQENQKYIIEINLSDLNLKPGNKLFDRIEWSFSRLNFFYDLLCYTTSNSAEINSQEIPFSKACRINLSLTSSTLENIKIPYFITEKGEANLRAELMKANEWIGMTLAKAERLKADDSVNPFISMYETLEPYAIDTCYISRIEGFISAQLISEILSSLGYHDLLI